MLKYGLFMVFLLGIPGYVVAQDSGTVLPKIVYNTMPVDTVDDYEIFVMDMDGSNKKNITNHKAVDWAYRSYNGKIYFVSDRDTTYRKYQLYEMDHTGEQVRKITNFTLEDSWLDFRNEGREMVITSPQDGARHELYLINQQGEVMQRLTNNDMYESDPCFSPDGQQIVFRSHESGIDELWLMDLNSGQRYQLTHYPTGDSSLQQHGYHAGPPDWNYVTNRISFASMRDGSYKILSIKPDGTDLTNVTDGSLNEVYHKWSADGKWLVFDGADSTGNYDIYLLDVENNKIRRLTDSSMFEGGPMFVYPE